MTVIHLIALVFIILYSAECHTSRKYKKMLKDLIEEQKNEQYRKEIF